MYRVAESLMETGRCPSIRAFTPTISVPGRGRCCSKHNILAHPTRADMLYAGRLTPMDPIQQSRHALVCNSPNNHIPGLTFH